VAAASAAAPSSCRRPWRPNRDDERASSGPSSESCPGRERRGERAAGRTAQKKRGETVATKCSRPVLPQRLRGMERPGFGCPAGNFTVQMSVSIGERRCGEGSGQASAGTGSDICRAGFAFAGGSLGGLGRTENRLQTLRSGRGKKDAIHFSLLLSTVSSGRRG
jgi:hypothetical protein